MLIDVHSHQFTPGMLNRDAFWGPAFEREGLRVGHWTLKTSRPKPESDEAALAAVLEHLALDHRIAHMDKEGVDRLILSTPSHAFMYWAGDFGDEYARICNDELAAFCAQAPDRFSFWAHANLARPETAAKELRRAIKDLGAKGLAIGGANFGGIEAHDERLFPIWEVLTEFDLPVQVHGYNESIWWGEKHTEDLFDTTSIVGDCVYETLYFWYLINGGVLDVFPTLKSHICHAGGMTLFQLGRLNDLNEFMATDRRNKRSLIEYMGNFYFDLDVHAHSLRRAIVDLVGVDNLLYGSNFGGGYANGNQTADIGLSAADQEKIRSGNALELFKLAG